MDLDRRRQPSATKGDVQNFWERNPLFVGEAASHGGHGFFAEHERVVIEDDFAGRVDEFYFAGLEGKRVLDVGCGPGFWVRQFAARGIDVTACDLTRAAVGLTKQSLDLFGLKAHLAVGDAESLPFRDTSFDHVNCQGVIHHTPDTAQCVREFHRVLAPEGTLIFSVYRRTFLLRHERLLGLVTRLLSLFRVGLRGRGRDGMLERVSCADELVRVYDGADNPLGKCYTARELEQLVNGRFRIEHLSLNKFPARAFPVRIPRRFQGFLSRHFGLLFVVRARRIDQ